MDGAGQTREAKSSPTAQLLEEAYTSAVLRHDIETGIAQAREAASLAQRGSGTQWQEAQASALAASLLLASGREQEAQAVIDQRCQFLRNTGRAESAQVEQRLGFLLYGVGGSDDVARLRHEYTLARDAGKIELSIAIGTALFMGCYHCGHTDEAVALVHECAQLAQRVVDTHHRLVTQVATGHFLAMLFAGEHDEQAQEYLNALLEQCRPQRQSRRRRPQAFMLRQEFVFTACYAMALQGHAQVLQRAGDHRAAVEVEALRAQLCHESGAWQETFDSLCRAASAASADGDDVKAEAFAQQALELEQYGALSPASVAAARIALGQYQLWSGDAQAAWASLQEAVDKAERSAAPVAVRARTLLWAGRAAQSLGDSETAKHCWHRAMDILSGDELTAEQHELLASAAIDVARTTLSLEGAGGSDPVIAVADTALRSAREAGMGQLVVHALDVCGRGRALAGMDEGLAYLEEAVEVAQTVGNEWVLADIRDSLGRALVALGRLSEAAPLLLQASEDYAQAQDPTTGGMAALLAARTFVQLGEFEQAYATYGSCLQLLSPSAQAYGVVAQEYAAVLESNGQVDAAAALRGSWAEVEPTR